MHEIQAIRERRQNAVKRALTLLELCKAADAESRASLLKTGVNALGDPAVAGAWIALAAGETDLEIRQGMIRRLADLDFRQIPDLAVCIELLVSCLAHADSRTWALACLTRIAPADPKIIEPLIAIFEKQNSAGQQNEILSVLCQREEYPPQLCSLFAARLDTFDTDFKTVILYRLLAQNALPIEAFEKLLVPSEPSKIKLLLISHMSDRSIVLDKVAAAVLRHDPDAACRTSAILLLTETGSLPADSVDALLEAASSDPEPEVRECAIAAFEHTLAKTPQVVETLLQALQKESSRPHVHLIMSLVVPHLQRSPVIVTAFLNLLKNNLNSDFTVQIYEALGNTLAWMPAMVDLLIASYTSEKDDRTKADILKALAHVNTLDERLIRLYSDALKCPEPKIQQWGVEGLMMLPLDEKQTPLIVEIASVLLTRELPYRLRLAAAKKIARIPAKSETLLKRLSQVAEQSLDKEIARVCELACIDASRHEVAEINWDAWHHLAAVEHRADGIFPAIYLHYEKSPTQAQRVLKALINPKCTDNLYQVYGYEVNEGTILRFLLKKKAIDDEISRYCMARILGDAQGSLETYLLCLASNPKFPALAQNVWKIFERGGGSLALMRDLLIAAYGGNEPAAHALGARFQDALPPETFLRYVRLLTENLGWPPSKPLLSSLGTRRDLSIEAANEINKALQKLGETMLATPAAPGFADD